MRQVRRRVAKLYLPAGGKYFGSREGYGLTYTSCQESGNRADFSAASRLAVSGLRSLSRYVLRCQKPISTPGDKADLRSHGTQNFSIEMQWAMTSLVQTFVGDLLGDVADGSSHYA